MALEKKGFIVLETPDPNLCYSFTSSLTRDVIYNQMLFSRRREIHKTIAQVYTRVSKIIPIITIMIIANTSNNTNFSNRNTLVICNTTVF